MGVSRESSICVAVSDSDDRFLDFCRGVAGSSCCLPSSLSSPTELDDVHAPSLDPQHTQHHGLLRTAAQQ